MRLRERATTGKGVTVAARDEVLAIENGLRKVGGTVLLDHVSLSISRGERWTLQGPTGSGKTVLLRAMALLDPLTGGQLRFEGGPLAADHIPAFRRRVIYLQQRPVLLEGTVEQNLAEVYCYQSAAGTRFHRQDAIEWLSVFDRDERFLDRSCSDLSGGESQIVALIRAVQLHPDVLLLDEPTTALDRESTEIYEALVNRWWDEASDRRSFVWISHDVAQRERMAKRVALMQHGRLTIL